MKLLGYDKAPDRQLVDLEPSDPGATDCQSTDGKCTEGYGANCNRAKRKPAHRKRPGRNRAEGSWGSANRFHTLHAVP